MSSIINRHRPTVFFNANKHDLDEINYLMFLWNVGLFDSHAFYRELTEYVANNAAHTKLKLNNELRTWLSAYRWRVFNSFDAAVKLKCGVLELIVEEVHTFGKASSKCAELGLSPDTARTYMELLEDEWRWPMLKRVLKTKLTQENVLRDFTLNPDDIYRQYQIDDQLYGIERVCHMVTNRTLSFIARGNRFENKDLAREMLERCIGYYYHERPLKNRLYASNYAKSAISGRSKQLIEYWTAPERARLVDAQAYGEDGVYTNRVKSIGDIEELVGQNHSDYNMQSLWERAI